MFQFDDDIDEYELRKERAATTKRLLRLMANPDPRDPYCPESEEDLAEEVSHD